MLRLAPQAFTLALAVSLVLMMVLSLCLGALALSPKEVLSVLFYPEQGEQASLVIHKIRLPRVLLACLLGALLGISGAAMQGLFRNPLADPALIGVSAGASVGASLAIVLGTSLTVGINLPVVSVGAFAGGLVAVTLVYKLSVNGGYRSVANMLLVGVAIAAIAAAIVQLLQLVASNDMLRQMSLWQMGGVFNATLYQVAMALVVLIVITVALMRQSHALNALLLGESEAQHLGVNVGRLQAVITLLVAAAVACSVTLAGNIAFVGLLVPHLVRLCIGPNHTNLLPCSALAGALLLVVADTMARTVFYPAEVPVGLVTALLGGPFFILLLRQRYNRGLS